VSFSGSLIGPERSVAMMWQQISEARAKKYAEHSGHMLKQWAFLPAGKQWPIYFATFYQSPITDNLSLTFCVKEGPNQWIQTNPIIGIPPDLLALFLTYAKDWLAARNYEASSEESRRTSNKRLRPTKST
jgi:hypothetical protein